MGKWLTDKLDEWTARAEVLRMSGAPGRAKMIEALVAELREGLKQEALRRLTLSEAAEETGISRRTLERYLKDEGLTNVGSEGAPLVLACELPRRASKAPQHIVAAATEVPPKKRAAPAIKRPTPAASARMERRPLDQAA